MPTAKARAVTIKEATQAKDQNPGKGRSKAQDRIPAATKMVHARVDEKIKEEAKKAFSGMGLSMSDAVRVFFTRVAAEKKLPFELKAPNRASRAAITEVEELKSKHRARFANATGLFDELEKNRRK